MKKIISIILCIYYGVILTYAQNQSVRANAIISNELPKTMTNNILGDLLANSTRRIPADTSPQQLIKYCNEISGYKGWTSYDANQVLLLMRKLAARNVKLKINYIEYDSKSFQSMINNLIRSIAWIIDNEASVLVAKTISTNDPKQTSAAINMLEKEMPSSMDIETPDGRNFRRLMEDHLFDLKAWREVVKVDEMLKRNNQREIHEAIAFFEQQMKSTNKWQGSGSSSLFPVGGRIVGWIHNYDNFIKLQMDRLNEVVQKEANEKEDAEFYKRLSPIYSENVNRRATSAKIKNIFFEPDKYSGKSVVVSVQLGELYGTFHALMDERSNFCLDVPAEVSNKVNRAYKAFGDGGIVEVKFLCKEPKEKDLMIPNWGVLLDISRPELLK